MNWNTIKAVANVTKVTIVKHSPEILMGLGTVGFIATVILASKETVKEQDVLEEHKEALEDAEDKKERLSVYKTTAIATAKNYIPAVTVGMASVACYFGAYGIMRKRYATLVVAYSALEESFRAYRQRVIDDKGEEADLYYLTGAKPKEITVKDEEGNKTKQKQIILPDGSLASPYAFKFSKYKENGERNLQWRPDNIMNRSYALGQQDYLNDQLYYRCVFTDDHCVKVRGWAFLNEARELLGEDANTAGAVVGNLMSNGEPGCNGYVDFRLTEATEHIFDPEVGKEVDLPCLIINPNVDGLIYDLIGKVEKNPFPLTYDKDNWDKY